MFPEPLPESCAVAIVDWHCAGHDTAHGVEELTPTPEVVVPRRGAYLREARGEERWLDPGSVSFAEAGELYRVRHPIPGGDQCTIFALSDAAAGELLGPDGRFPSADAPLTGRAYLLHRLALGASRQRRAHPAAALASEEYGGAFLRAAVAPLAPISPASRIREHVMRAREMIARHYREPLTLSAIASAAGCSAFHLSRAFTRTFGMPVWRQVLRLRLRDALEQILETRDGLAQIALGIGFASQSHFGDAFRAEFGHAPGRVRRLAGSQIRVLRAKIR